MLAIIEGPIHWLEGFGVNSNYLYAIIGFLFCIWAFFALDLDSTRVFSIAFATAPIWLPFTTFLIFFEAWLEYVRKDFNIQNGRTTIEIKLPQEIFKSPEAMEMVIAQMYQTAGADNHVQTYWDGKHPPRHSLELVSRGGDVRFYINTPKKKFKNLIETQLYAHYPGIEVHELDIDYTAEIPWDPSRYSYMVFHYGLKKPDAYPIKTYIEYGLDKMPKEEEKIDPLNTMIEMLGSIGPGEHLWIQILITANREVGFKEGSLHRTPDWKAAARKQINKIIVEAAKRVGIKEEQLKEKGSNMSQLLTETEKDTIKAIERTLGKNAFDTVIRGFYIGTKEAYNAGERLAGLNTSWNAFADLNRNQIGVMWRSDFNWNWWQDPFDKRKTKYKKYELTEYKKRVYTNHSLSDKPKVMTTEELATIFHLPGKVATTPSLSRIPSKRSEPPANLPVG